MWPHLGTTIKYKVEFYPVVHDLHFQRTSGAVKVHILGVPDAHSSAFTNHWEASGDISPGNLPSACLIDL